MKTLSAWMGYFICHPLSDFELNKRRICLIGLGVTPAALLKDASQQRSHIAFKSFNVHSLISQAFLHPQAPNKEPYLSPLCQWIRLKGPIVGENFKCMIGVLHLSSNVWLWVKQNETLLNIPTQFQIFLLRNSLNFTFLKNCAKLDETIILFKVNVRY